MLSNELDIYVEKTIKEADEIIDKVRYFVSTFSNEARQDEETKENLDEIEGAILKAEEHKQKLIDELVLMATIINMFFDE